MSERRRRVGLLLVCTACAVLGVASKYYRGAGSRYAIGQGEDFFGTMFLILAPRVVFLRVAFWKVAAPVLAIVMGIEFSQLLHGEEMERIRGTWLGLHVLGSCFEWLDVVAYVGAALAARWVDRRHG